LLAGGLALIAALSPTAAHATILLFDQARDATSNSIVVPTGSGSRLPTDYGDNVSASVMAVLGGFFTYGDGGEGFTPDISVDIFSSLATPSDPSVRLWQTGYGDLVNAVFASGPVTQGAPFLNVLFTAAPGYVVDLYGFDLAGFGADYTIAGVDVLAGAVSLYSDTDVLVEGNASGPLHTPFHFTTPLSAPEVLLRIDLSNLSASIQDNVAIDSIRFGQTPPRVLPEPGTALLLLSGLALTAAATAKRPRAGELRMPRR
jgi:hypothetical protein